jgi:proline-specific peptidase
MSVQAKREGRIPFRRHRTWYRIVGQWPVAGAAPPLLVLHGGPGMPHDYLTDLDLLADSGRTVVYYDQLGCGNSDHPDDATLWTMGTFVAEVGAVRSALGLERVHLLGHSWGGWLALEYALRRPAGLTSLVLASVCASVPSYTAEARRLKQSLPAEDRLAIDRHEAQGTTHSPEYRQATRAYASRWLYRNGALPDHVRRSLMSLSEDVFETMHGPQWNVTGNLKDWDVTTRLGELDPPVLVTAGRHDEMTPTLVQPLIDGIRDAEAVVFEDSAHTATAEEPERYREVLAAFLGRVEAARAEG